MGRIAEALKRAQQERTQREHPDGSRAGAGSPPSAAERLQNAMGGSDVLQSSILEMPAMPRPFLGSSAPITVDSIDPRVVAFHDPTSGIAERYRSVRTRLMTTNPVGSARSIAITSSLPGEGKTITVANLGFSLAELRHLRVAMIDVDFRQRGLSRLFGVADRPGLAEVLRGEKTLADVCLPIARGNLYLVPAGESPDNSPSELLAGARASALFRELNERFHHNLIDSPPASTVADIGLIAPLCHSVLVVIRMNRTPEPVLRRSVKMLQANHVPIIGCILAGSNDDALVASDSHDFYQAES